MSEGDTVYVHGGVYNETGIIQIKKSNVKLLNAPGESPTIHCAQQPQYHGIYVNSSVNITLSDGAKAIAAIGNITIEGFEIRNCLNGMRLDNVYDSVIRRNWIHDNKSQGILGSTKNTLIDRNVINHNGNFAGCASGETSWGTGTSVCNKDHGLYLTGSDYVITNNLIYDNLASGIQMAGYPWDMSKYGGGGIDFVGHGNRPDPSYAGASGWLIANNTIAYNGLLAIGIWQPDAGNSRIINNIFYENGVKASSNDINGIGFTSPGSGSKGHKFDNNIFYASGGGATKMFGVAGIEGVNYTQTGNITANPNFEGAGATLSGVPNFKLLAGSPAIDKGQSLSQVTWDHQGIKRPAGAAFEIGAYEFCPPSTVCEQGSPPPNPTGGGGFIPPAGGGGIGSCYK